MRCRARVVMDDRPGSGWALMAGNHQSSRPAPAQQRPQHHIAGGPDLQRGWYPRAVLGSGEQILRCDKLVPVLHARERLLVADEVLEGEDWRVVDDHDQVLAALDTCTLAPEKPSSTAVSSTFSAVTIWYEFSSLLR